MMQFTTEQSAKIASAVAELTAARLPLSTGLRALAEEEPHGSVRQALNELAARLESGESFENAVSNDSLALSEPWRRLLIAATISGRAAETLQVLSGAHLATAEIRRQLWVALMYPGLLVVLAAALLLYYDLYILGSVQEIVTSFVGYGLDENGLQASVTATASRAGLILVSSAAKFAFLAVATILVFGPRAKALFIQSLPLIGPIYQWLRVSEFLTLTGVFLRGATPLDTAVRLGGEALGDPDISDAADQIATAVHAGMSLSESWRAQPSLPPSVQPLLIGGEVAGNLPEAVLVAAAYCRGRGEQQLARLRVMAPPICFLFVALVAGSCLAAIGRPLFTLIKMLTG